MLTMSLYSNVEALKGDRPRFHGRVRRAAKTFIMWKTVSIFFNKVKPLFGTLGYLIFWPQCDTRLLRVLGVFLEETLGS